jgi:3-oxoadipyl-CoA thiolase
MDELREAYICDAVRTPIGRFGGALAHTRTDDLAAVPLSALRTRNSEADWDALDEVTLGCANQAGEDNRNVARMALLLAEFPERVPGVTVNRLCASGLEAVGGTARAIRTGEAEFAIAGGVESMSRAPMVMAKAEKPFQRTAEIFDTTIGWRFVNPLLQAQYGIDSMPETAENVAEQFQIAREDQDAFALRSQRRAAVAIENGYFAEEIVRVHSKDGNGKPVIVAKDEHPRPATTLQDLARLKAPFRENGTVTAGNASGINDGAAAMILASETALTKHQLRPRARFLGMAAAGVAPRVMGIGPVPATEKLIARLRLRISDFHVIELNEAFASQALAVLQSLGLSSDAAHVNPNGGAIALGHPLGMSGARLVLTAVHQLEKTGAKRALISLCVGVGQGVSMAVERV